MKSMLILLLKKNSYENIKENIKNAIEPTAEPNALACTELPSIQEITASTKEK